MTMGKKQYVVIGLGRFGRAVCETLYENGAEVLAVDICQDRVNDAVSYSTHAVCTDASEEGVLRDLGIGNFDVAVVAIGNQIKASSMIALLLKEMGVGTVIARANDEIHGRMLKKLGADKVVYPERDMGRRVGHNLHQHHIMDFIEVSPDYALSEIRPLEKWVGKNLGQLAMRAHYGINVLAIKTGDSVNGAPDAHTVVGSDDVLLILGSTDALRNLEK